MRKLLTALLALLLPAAAIAQIVPAQTMPYGNGTSPVALPATPVALPSLPLALGSKVLGFGDSLTQFNAFGVRTLAVSSSASGVIEAAWAADPRFNFDYWYDTASPWAGAGTGIAWRGANQGIAGDHLVYGPTFGGGIINRVAYALSRGPQIVVLNAGTNSINSGDGYSSDAGATGGAGNGASAAYVTAKIDAIINQCTQRGVWVVLSTLYPRADWPSGDARHQVLRDVNTWIRAQAGRSGVKIVDPYDALVSPTDPDGVNTALFQTDKIHPNPGGAYVIGVQYLLPVLQTMIASGTVFSTDITASNLYATSTAQMNGTTGTLSNGALGTVPTGYTVNRSRGTSTVVSSIEAASGYNRLVLTITPVNDASGTAYHTVTVTPPDAGITGLSAGDWVQFYLHIEANDASSFGVARMLASVNQSSTQRVAAYAQVESSANFAISFAGRGNYWLVTKPMQIPIGVVSFDRTRINPLEINWPKTGPSTFTVKIDRPIARKISDPRTAWGLP